MTRTSMFLDRDLVSEAQAVLGTKTVVETVHAALEKAVERERRAEALETIKRLVDWDEVERLRRAEKNR